VRTGSERPIGGAGFNPGPAGRFRVFEFQGRMINFSGKQEGSTVSSIFRDCWPI